MKLGDLRQRRRKFYLGNVGLHQIVPTATTAERQNEFPINGT